jgi:hypothetical protein
MINNEGKKSATTTTSLQSKFILITIFPISANKCIVSVQRKNEISRKQLQATPSDFGHKTRERERGKTKNCIIKSLILRLFIYFQFINQAGNGRI